VILAVTDVLVDVLVDADLRGQQCSGGFSYAPSFRTQTYH
jgi:hypothetical protein